MMNQISENIEKIIQEHISEDKISIGMGILINFHAAFQRTIIYFCVLPLIAVVNYFLKLLLRQP